MERKAYAIENKSIESPLRHAAIREAFEQASQKVYEQERWVDQYVRNGELGVSDVIESLLAVLGQRGDIEYVDSWKVQKA